MFELIKKNMFFIIVTILIIVFLIVTKEDDADVHGSDFHTVSSIPVEMTEDIKLDQEEINVVVDIKGEVKTPGVYQVEIDFRVNDVIQIAGGFTEDADESQVNLAQKVQDEMIILIPKKGETEELNNSPNNNGSAKLRLNYATQEELEGLNGIGPSKAQAIIQYREENGLFRTIEDLLKVSGIGQKTLENIRDSIQLP
ncbi:helix-hairpin-helix domain-containing protein [Virgibacillus sp. C22-A2]|uniref:Helix-hairpin-helix domain-containing protein n=1 Tax=Virgibacillus tibetensis TaxID=3042313 RepID=A0ABU6KCE2_9BACI|nr:helix-hairpin-helix domain-containing protein [Virgibacillus sp. C22-A2]